MDEFNQVCQVLVFFFRVPRGQILVEYKGNI